VSKARTCHPRSCAGRTHGNSSEGEARLLPRDARPPTGAGAHDVKTAALRSVAAAAALRSEAALWKALEVALLAGAQWEELEAVIEEAAQQAAAAVREDALRAYREVRARHRTKERWGIPED